MTLDRLMLCAVWFVLLLVGLMALLNFTSLPDRMAVTSCYSADGTAACYREE